VKRRGNLSGYVEKHKAVPSVLHARHGNSKQINPYKSTPQALDIITQGVD